jgi:hypothetical protein
VRAALSLSLVAIACGGARPIAPSPPAVTHVAEPGAAVVTPSPAPSRASRPIPPAGRAGPIASWRGMWSRDEGILFDGSLVPVRASEISFGKKSDYWSPCVRDFVETQPEAARAALGEALSLYSTTCTKDPEWRVELQAPRAGRTTPGRSPLALHGTLGRGTCELALRFSYQGEPAHAERITLIADGVWWSSSRLDFDADDGWEVATLPFTRSLARVVARAIEARDTVLRFESAKGYEDIVVTDELKQELRVMIDALDAINRP